MTLLIPVVDDRVLEAVVEWDPGPRWNPLVAAVILFGLPSVILATATPIAVRLRGALADGPGEDRRPPVRDLHRGQHRRDLRHGLLPDSRGGHDQLLGMLATGLFRRGRARRARRAHARCPGRLSPCSSRRSVAATVAARPRTKGDDSRRGRPKLVSALPERGERQEVAPRASGLRARATRRTRVTTACPWWTTARRGTCVSTARSRAACTSTTRFARGTSTRTTCSSRSPTNPARGRSCSSGSAAARLQKRMWRDFPGVDQQVVELDPVVRDVAYRYFELPRSPRVRVTVEDGRRYPAATTTSGGTRS